MKKLQSVYTILVLALLISVAPVFSFAQGIKEAYLRPSYWRPYDKAGINVFETSKVADTIAYEGMRFRIGAGFTQQFQGLKHSSTVMSEAANKLYPLTPGFNTAMANLNVDVQL